MPNSANAIIYRCDGNTRGRGTNSGRGHGANTHTPPISEVTCFCCDHRGHYSGDCRVKDEDLYCKWCDTKRHNTNAFCESKNKERKDRQLGSQMPRAATPSGSQRAQKTMDSRPNSPIRGARTDGESEPEGEEAVFRIGRLNDEKAVCSKVVENESFCL